MSAGLGVLASLSIDCSSGDVVPTDSGSSPEATPTCLVNVETQNGAACDAPEGYLCPTDFPCTDPSLAQQANCVCTNGNWQCSYAAGSLAVIPAGTTPVCEGSGAPSACPAAETPGAPCMTAMAGLTCYYPGPTCGAKFVDTDSSFAQ